jgi:hypothetical protein
LMVTYAEGREGALHRPSELHAATVKATGTPAAVQAVRELPVHK